MSSFIDTRRWLRLVEVTGRCCNGAGRLPRLLLVAMVLAGTGLSALAQPFPPFCGPALLNARVLLQGALTLTPLRTTLDAPAGVNLMGDELRVGQAGMPFIPLAQPYSAFPASASYQFVGTSGAETIAPAVLATTGANAIVDWVFLELRDAADNTRIVATRAALVQRDGDIVDLDGSSGVTFNITAENYFVAVRHRNHLGVMTAAPVAVGTGMPVLDFSSAATPLYVNPDVFAVAGSQTAALGDGRRALWGGDASQVLLSNDHTQPGRVRHKVKFTGGGNDTDAVNAAVLFYQFPPLNSLDFDQAFGYLTEDATMDGRAQYVPPGFPPPLPGDACGALSGGGQAIDDTLLICSTVVQYPANLTANPAYDFVIEHLPSTRVLAAPPAPGIVACPLVPPPPISVPLFGVPAHLLLSMLLIGMGYVGLRRRS